MKFTEGSFKEWGYQLAKDDYPDICITEQELFSNFGGKLPDGKILIKDRIADSMFQQHCPPDQAAPRQGGPPSHTRHPSGS